MGRHEQVIKELVLSRVANCGQCGGGYRLSDVNVLGSKEDLWFLMLVCGHCHQAVGVAAVVKEQKVDAARGEGKPATRPAKTSSDPHEPLRNRALSKDPISFTDVSAIRDFLVDFDGDFRRLFAKNPPNHPQSP